MCTLRGGELTKEEKEAYHEQWDEDDEQDEKEAKEKKEKEKKDEKEEKEGKVKAEGGGAMPAVGEAVGAAGNSTWVPSTVLRLRGNFVETDAMIRKGKNVEHGLPLGLRSGLEIQVRSKGSTWRVIVLTVGWVWTTGRNKYRAVIVRRRSADSDEWGGIEMVSASCFPDARFCKVHAHALILHGHTQHNSVIYIAMYVYV